jgi:hypothetical protein
VEDRHQAGQAAGLRPVRGNLGADGRQRRGAFIGLPGNPVSSFVTFLMLVRPFILKSQGATELRPRARGLQADFDFKGDPRREFLRARINDTGGLDLFPNQSSGVLTSCTWADGLIDNPPHRAIAAMATRCASCRFPNCYSQSMTVKVLFFAGLREALGAASESLALPPGIATAGALRDHLAARGQAWARWPR